MPASKQGDINPLRLRKIMPPPRSKFDPGPTQGKPGNLHLADQSNPARPFDRTLGFAGTATLPAPGLALPATLSGAMPAWWGEAGVSRGSTGIINLARSCQSRRLLLGASVGEVPASVGYRRIVSPCNEARTAYQNGNEGQPLYRESHQTP